MYSQPNLAKVRENLAVGVAFSTENALIGRAMRNLRKVYGALLCLATIKA